MAPLIGKEMSQRLFLQRFATLCVDPLFHVRKVCAANFGDFSGVVGSDPTEQTLVSTYTSWKGNPGNICKLDSEVVGEVTSIGYVDEGWKYLIWRLFSPTISYDLHLHEQSGEKCLIAI